MNKWDTVAIFGVGLIGGSIGLGLRKRGLARQIVGIGRSTERLQHALDAGSVTEITTDLAAGVKNAQLVIVCTPVERIVEHVMQVAQHCPTEALLTDAGSTKLQIVSQLDERLPSDGPAFVGSHPLAGSEKSGSENADEDLFKQRTVVVTPTSQSCPTAVETITNFWSSLDAQVAERTPQEHDAALATTSHLPHLIASVLAATTPAEELELTASGWQDTTRIAAGDPELWRQIVNDNRDNVLTSLDHFEQTLSKLRTAIHDQDGAALLEILTQGKQNRDAVGD